MKIRLAEARDIEQLVKMRWDFTLEDDDSGTLQDSEFSEFHSECFSFLSDAIANDDWFIWVAEDDDGKIISHIYIELVHKVPRPGRVTYPFAYMTNVYTIPSQRGNGIGSKLISTVNEWAETQNCEFIIVWPSDESVDFYGRNGYRHCKEPMEYMI